MNVDKRKAVLIATIVIGLAVGAVVVQRKVVEHQRVLSIAKSVN